MTETPAMRWCKNCFEPTTRPGQVFDENGLCTPCHFAKIDVSKEEWNRRKEELKEIVNWAKARRSPSGYNSVIGVSGGKDSTRLALFAREIGLSPLLVSCTYQPQQMTELGAENLSNLVNLGFDVITINIAPETARRAIRASFLSFSNWCRPSELALYSSIPRVALTQGIPLACAGENPFLAFGNSCGSIDGDASDITSMHTLGDGDLTPYMKDGNRPEDMLLYRFPNKDKSAHEKLRMIYLGYYIEGYSLSNNAEFAINYGFKPRCDSEADPLRTGSYHNHTAVDEDFVIVNQFLKYLKFGFGNVTQQVSSDIRDGRLGRAEALEIIQRYDGLCDIDYIKKFVRFLGITEEQFWDIAEKARNPDIWKRVGDEWELKYKPSL